MSSAGRSRKPHCVSCLWSVPSCDTCSNLDLRSMSSPAEIFLAVPQASFSTSQLSLLICTPSLDLANIRSYTGAVLQTPENIAPVGPRLSMQLVGLRQQIDRIELRFSELAVAFTKTDHWDYEGSITAID